MLVCLYCHLPAKKTSLSVAELIQQKTFCVCSFLKNLYKNKQILWLGKIFSTCYCLPAVFISSASAWTCRQSHTHGLEFSIAFLVSSARFCVLQAAEHFRGEAHPLSPGGVPWIHCICVAPALLADALLSPCVCSWAGSALSSGMICIACFIPSLSGLDYTFILQALTPCCPLSVPCTCVTPCCRPGAVGETLLAPHSARWKICCWIEMRGA